jgi:PhnB protein
MAVKGSVPNPGTIVPHLVVRNMQEAVEFYAGAFSANVLYRSPSPSGEGEHAHLSVWSSLIQVSTEEPGYQRRQMAGAFLAAPESLGGSTCVFQVGVPDVDAAYQRAVDHGALPALPPTDMFWGDRYGWVRDPFGHMWALCSVREVLTPDEVAMRMQAAGSSTKGQNR